MSRGLSLKSQLFGFAVSA